MSVSLIINTSALGPRAATTLGGDGLRAKPDSPARHVPHADRTYALRNWILPLCVAAECFDEVIVVGEWEPGPGYRYIHVPSVHFSSADALAQRQAGFDASRGDIIVHMHDDHVIEGIQEPSLWDVLVPERWTRLRNPAGERLPNGIEHGYISGHCAIYKHKVLKTCPWRAVPAVRDWDVKHTEQIKAAGFGVGQAIGLRVWDTERGSTPWL